jgi:hypothetical protein
LTHTRERTQMSDQPPHTDIGEDTGSGESATGKSRLLRGLGIAIAIALVVLVVVLHLTGTLGPGDH